MSQKFEAPLPGHVIPSIFAAFITEPRGVGWRYVAGKKGKRTKPPLDPHTSDYARDDAPETWGNYAQALARVGGKIGTAHGVGLEILDGSEEVKVLDLDGSYDPATKTTAQWAREIIERFNSYTEWSPSGRGFKIFYWDGRAGTGYGCRPMPGPPIDG